MTIRELIQQLENFDPDKKIVVESYESGYDDIQVIKEQNVTEEVNNWWWDGKYQVLNEPSSETQTVVCLIARTKKSQ